MGLAGVQALGGLVRPLQGDTETIWCATIPDGLPRILRRRFEVQRAEPFWASDDSIEPTGPERNPPSEHICMYK